MLRQFTKSNILQLFTKASTPAYNFSDNKWKDKEQSTERVYIDKTESIFMTKFRIAPQKTTQ